MSYIDNYCIDGKTKTCTHIRIYLSLEKMNRLDIEHNFFIEMCILPLPYDNIITFKFKHRVEFDQKLKLKIRLSSQLSNIILEILVIIIIIIILELCVLQV